VGELLTEKVALDIEGIDRLYLNLYQPMLQTGAGVATFFKQHPRSVPGCGAVTILFVAHWWRTRPQETAVLHNKRRQAAARIPLIFLSSFVVACCLLRSLIRWSLVRFQQGAPKKQ
jgi:hypothetical protein